MEQAILDPVKVGWYITYFKELAIGIAAIVTAIVTWRYRRGKK